MFFLLLHDINHISTKKLSSKYLNLSKNSSTDNVPRISVHALPSVSVVPY